MITDGLFVVVAYLYPFLVLFLKNKATKLIVKTMVIRTIAAPHAFVLATALKDSSARTSMCVGRVVIGSLKEWGTVTPKKVVAVNMMGAVSPAALANPRSNPVTIP